MRPALRLIRYRQRPMQQSLDNFPPLPVKRSLSQQATARVQPPQNVADFPPAKRQRAEADSSTFSPSRHRSFPSSSSAFPSNTMAFRGRGSSKRPGAPPSLDAADRPSSSSHRHQAKQSKRSNRSSAPKNILNGPLHDQDFIIKEYFKSDVDLKDHEKRIPKSPLHNFYALVKNGQQPRYESTRGSVIKGDKYVEIFRTTVFLDIDPPIFGVGDHTDKKDSINLAALSALYQLHGLKLLDNPRRLAPLQSEPPPEITLSDGSTVTFERARSFMDYYCRRFGFSKPEVDFTANPGGSRWEAVMTVGERRIGMGSGKNKKNAQIQCFLDVTQYLENCDPDLWKAFVDAARTGKDLGLAPKVLFYSSPVIETNIEDLCHDVRRSTLYRNRPSLSAGYSEAFVSRLDGSPQAASLSALYQSRKPLQTTLAIKSKRLQDRRKEYLADPKMEKMRNTRATLPVYAQAKEVMEHISKNEVTICMAATGSGKTTQLPQMILDGYIDRGEGAECNIICTQPRRLAAISVAHRVANERGEQIGRSVGYHVRFESKLPDPHGSITFCTTGVFLKRLQSLLSDEHGHGEFDKISHIIVDEVHERDVDTDLLLVVLKHLMAQKKAKNQSLKIILMSATIDPSLFQKYFADEQGAPADTIDVPGRSFPVTKYFMEDFTSRVLLGPLNWVKNQENVARYLVRELGLAAATQLGVRVSGAVETRDDLELPYPFMAAMISHVLQNSEDGHVLVFLPGWDEIAATQRALLSPQGPLGIDFSSSNYSLHLLHSSIPLTEQQAIFDPPEKGVRRVILATNIAETSVTIPDVVYVIDTAKIKEQRYDPDRHMSSLVSSWVGSSNLNQRAGRAGRHRSGEYYGILGKARAESLQTHQTVEMKRVDLSNVVMHVKALNFPGMTVEEVLAAAIEPPDPSRVDAAMKNLQMVGALDSKKNLTSLGKVLLQLPVDAQVGKMVLYGSFFRCLDQALTLAAILTNREPFLSPMHVRHEAQRVKNSWSPEDFRSDVLAALSAYNTWWSMQSRGDYFAANRFCSENFLSKPTFLLIQKVRNHLLQALYRAGAIDVSAGGEAAIESRRSRDGGDGYDERRLIVPDALNANKHSMPLLTALISIAAQPKFAIRKDKQSFRTATDKFALIHPSSVNNRKREVAQADQSEDKDKQANAPAEEKQLYAFVEKRRNDTIGASATTFLVATTRLDPLVYILFGAHNVEVVQGGLECDDWLPIKGDLRTLDDIWRLKTSLEAAMLRVFEGILMSRQRGKLNLRVLPREADDEAEWEDEDDSRDYSLSMDEVRDLDEMTSALVNLLNAYSDERIASQSVHNSRAGTPAGSPFLNSGRQLPPSGSGRTTPFYQSRPGTPSRFRRS